MERKLAAILAADVVGFTGRIAKDEEGTLSLLNTMLDEIVSVQVEACRGRIFKTLGDGVLAEFSSTVEALNCAIGIQSTMATQAHQNPDSSPLQLRIGVSVGDVVVQDDDLLGDGVNLAARLEVMAEPGGIAISGEVMAQVKGKTEVDFEDIGYKRLKSSDDPIRVFKTSQGKDDASGLFDFNEDSLRPSLIQGGCLCGSVRFESNMPPISTGYCHCGICQKFTGSAMSTWTAFPATALSFVAKEPRYFQSSAIAKRGFCANCGSSMTYRLVQPRVAGWIAVFTSSLDNPQDFAPAVHGGIESKMPWLDIIDDLPKTTCAESRALQEAWNSVGLVDPESWGPDADPPKLF